MKKNLKRHIVKIPGGISVLYCRKNKILLFKSAFTKRSIELKTKIFMSEDRKVIQVTKIPFFKMSNSKNRALKGLQGVSIALMKQTILEMSVLLCNKLKFVGVGYKGDFLDVFSSRLLRLKLGYSHEIYFKVPKELSIASTKSTNFFIFWNSLDLVRQTAAVIRSYKVPEVDKGKGILRENEKISIKEGKKIWK